MIVMVMYGVVREGMTSRSGIMQPFYRLCSIGGTSDAVAVSDGFLVGRIRRCRVARTGRGATVAQPVDHAPQVAVGNRLAMFPHGDDGVVHLPELVGGERKAKR